MRRAVTLGALPDCKCPEPEEMSASALEAYSACCGKEVAFDFVKTNTGMDPSSIPLNSDGSPDFKKGAVLAIEYAAGTPIDTDVLNPDGSINFKTAVADAGAIAAAAICTAYGAGAVAPLCGALGGEIGKAVYEVGSQFVSMFESDPPYAQLTPSDSVNLVARWWGSYQAQYMRNLATARGLVLVQLHTAQKLNAMHSKIAKAPKSLAETWNMLASNGFMQVIPGWLDLLGLSTDAWASSKDDFTATNNKIRISEIGISRILYGFVPDPLFDKMAHEGALDSFLGAKTEMTLHNHYLTGNACDAGEWIPASGCQPLNPDVCDVPAAFVSSPGAVGPGGACVKGAFPDPSVPVAPSTMTAGSPVRVLNRLFYVWSMKGGTVLGAITDADTKTPQELANIQPGQPEYPAGKDQLGNYYDFKYFVDSYNKPALWQDPIWGIGTLAGTCSGSGSTTCDFNAILGGDEVNVVGNSGVRAYASRDPASMIAAKTTFMASVQSAAAKLPLLALREARGLSIDKAPVGLDEATVAVLTCFGKCGDDACTTACKEANPGYDPCALLPGGLECAIKTTAAGGDCKANCTPEHVAASEIEACLATCTTASEMSSGGGGGFGKLLLWSLGGLAAYAAVQMYRKKPIVPAFLRMSRSLRRRDAAATGYEHERRGPVHNNRQEGAMAYA